MCARLTANIVADLQHVEDERAMIGYLMTLCVCFLRSIDEVNEMRSRRGVMLAKV